MLKVYSYQGCSTCKAATKWLKAKGIAFEEKPIRETPPTGAELKAMLKARGGIKALVNTSGLDYRAMGIKDKIAGMSEAEALKLLSANGNLVKRPFALDTDRGVHLVGFKEDEWARELK